VLKAGGLSLDLASLNAGVTVEKPREPAPVASQGGVDCSLAAIHWTSTESIGTREAYKDHLARFPTCAFATLATARIAALDVKTEPAPAATPKSCARGLALTSDGECVRQQAPKRVVVRRTGTGAQRNGRAAARWIATIPWGLWGASAGLYPNISDRHGFKGRAAIARRAPPGRLPGRHDHLHQYVTTRHRHSNLLRPRASMPHFPERGHEPRWIYSRAVWAMRS
jgi:hypothetical protein